MMYSLILIATSAFVHAATPLEQLDRFLGCSRLSVSFRLNDSAIVRSESCIGSACDTFRTKQQIAALDDMQAMISSMDSGGKVFQQTVLSAQEWSQLNCNMARFHVKNMEGSGFQVSLSDPVVSHQALKLNGVRTEVETRRIEIAGVNRLGMRIHHVLELTREGGGLAQMLIREQKSSAGVDRFTVEEFSGGER